MSLNITQLGLQTPEELLQSLSYPHSHPQTTDILQCLDELREIVKDMGRNFYSRPVPQPAPLQPAEPAERTALPVGSVRISSTRLGSARIGSARLRDNPLVCTQQEQQEQQELVELVELVELQGKCR